MELNTKRRILFYFFFMLYTIGILNPCNNIKLKWIHAVGKDGKGDPMGTALMNMQITTKSMLRPQKWFVNVMLPKPSIKYIKEAEENGLKYQIENLKNKLEKDNLDLFRDNYNHRIWETETKMRNKLRTAKEIFQEPENLTVVP